MLHTWRDAAGRGGESEEGRGDAPKALALLYLFAEEEFGRVLQKVWKSNNKSSGAFFFDVTAGLPPEVLLPDATLNTSLVKVRTIS